MSTKNDKNGHANRPETGGAPPKLNGKKHLGMLPEVLPAPTTGSVEGSPRQRTLRTMERMFTAAAASAIIAGCSGGGGSSGGGYGVVDPLPPPAGGGPDFPPDCSRLSESIPFSAFWRDAPDGSGLIVELRLSQPGVAGTSYSEASLPTVVGGKLVNATFEKEITVILVSPDPGRTFAAVDVEVLCGSSTTIVHAQLDLGTEPPEAGDLVAVTLFE